MSHPSQGIVNYNNPRSGISTGLPEAETEVLFPIAFSRAPHIILTPTSRAEVWICDVYEDGTGFKWENANESENVTVHWIADLE